MTPKEKAEDLAEKMLGGNNHYLNTNIEIDKLIAKQCALICVDEILENYFEDKHKRELHSGDLSKEVDMLYFGDHYNYWEEVKRELTQNKEEYLRTIVSSGYVNR